MVVHILQLGLQNQPFSVGFTQYKDWAEPALFFLRGVFFFAGTRRLKQGLNELY